MSRPLYQLPCSNTILHISKINFFNQHLTINHFVFSNFKKENIWVFVYKETACIYDLQTTCLTNKSEFVFRTDITEQQFRTWCQARGRIINFIDFRDTHEFFQWYHTRYLGSFVFSESIYCPLGLALKHILNHPAEPQSVAQFPPLHLSSSWSCVVNAMLLW